MSELLKSHLVCHLFKELLDPPDGVALSEGQLAISLGLEVIERLAERHPGHGRGHAARRPGWRTWRRSRGWGRSRGVGGRAPRRGRGGVAPTSVTGPEQMEFVSRQPFFFHLIIYLFPFGLDSSWRFLLLAAGLPSICSRVRGLKSYRGLLSAASFFFLKIVSVKCEEDAGDHKWWLTRFAFK